CFGGVPSPSPRQAPVFPGGRGIFGGVSRSHIGAFGGRLFFPAVDSANSLQEFLIQQVLQQVSAGPNFHSAEHLDVTSVCGQDNDSSFRKFFENRGHGVKATHLGHLQVHQDDVRTVCSELFNCLASIGSFRN